jgi:hypothetical protein
MRRALHAMTALLLLAGCADTAPGEPRAEEDRKTAVPPDEPLERAAVPGNEPLEPGGLTAPPPVTLRYVDQAVDLHAWTFCYKDGCVDEAPPRDPFDVGDPGEVGVEFPLSGWSFRASFTPAGERCGRVHTVPLEATGDGTFVLRPAGDAGTYDVTLMGRGDGDLFTTFRWTTPADGPIPTPRARLAVLAGHDGTVDSYGVELVVSNLARTPREASARITVEAGDGNALTFTAEPAAGRCFPEGTVYWDGPDDEGLQAAQLGDGPFTYKVELVLDGVRYVADAAWPDDEIPGNAPSVSLDFTPSLPALE